MNPSFWRHIHGGATHFPIVLLLASVVFDFVATRSRDEGLRAGLHAAGLGSAVVGTLGTFGAVIAGLAMTRGRTLGAGPERIHHLFVWPAVMFSTVLVAWRLVKRGRAHSLRFYLAGMSVASTLMLAAGYSGGEMLAAETGNNAFLRPDLQATDTVEPAPATAGRQLFLKNCAHCHGADAHGDEGPDLHNLDWTDEQIATRIRNGKKGQMTAFAGKFSPQQITEVIAYLRTLK